MSWNTVYQEVIAKSLKKNLAQMVFVKLGVAYNDFFLIRWSKKPHVIIPLSSRYRNEILPPKRGDNGMIKEIFDQNARYHPVITPLWSRYVQGIVRT